MVSKRHTVSGYSLFSPKADDLLASTLADISLGKAFELGYQQWPMIHSRQIVIRAVLSVNTMGPDLFKRLCRSDNPRALRYVNQALILLMTMFQDMIRCAANQSPQGIDYRRVLPRRSVPDTTWL